MTMPVSARDPRERLPCGPAAWPDLATHRGWLESECCRLLDFGRLAGHPDGGASWLDHRGRPLLDEPVHTWITARMVHVYGMGSLMGVPGSAAVAAKALAGLHGRLRDDVHGGWYSASGPHTAREVKVCYDHAFVLLAASTAAFAELAGADRLLAEAAEIFEKYFWDEDAGLCVDSWDRGWNHAHAYRGINANMHAVEAMLAAADTTGDEKWRARALRVCTALVGIAEKHEWRIPEHYDESWQPLLNYNSERRDDPFKPYGATVGHGLEWARLLLHVEAGVPGHAPPQLLPAAVSLFDRAATDGWSVDGAPGFVYTTDWDGAPVVRDRMHWVVAEAVCAASALWQRTGESRFAASYRTWWDYAAQFLLDLDGGSWHHQLDRRNAPSDTVWKGKADLYHAVQSTLVPRLPLAPTMARALAEGMLR
jgi:sulfoquinovose isomerase